MRVEFEIDGRIPSYNEWHNWHWAKRQRLKKEYEEYSAWLARSRLRGQLKPPVTVSITVLLKSNRRVDADNYSMNPALKGLLDGLVAAGAVPDDSVRYVPERRVRVLTGQAKDAVRVVIEDAEEGRLG